MARIQDIPRRIRRQIHRQYWHVRKDLRIFLTLRVLFPFVYRFYAGRRPIRSRKAVFVEVRFRGLTDNFRLVARRMKEKGCTLSLHCLENTRRDQFGYMRRCLRMIRDIADARYIFLNDACSVTSCLPLREGSEIFQLWHACGAFKKFGMSTAERIFGEDRRTLEKYPNYGNLKYVTVSSPEVIWAYEEAMNLPHEKGQVVAAGIARTDLFYDPSYRKAAKRRVCRACPSAAGKKVILYAPTFRGRVAQAKSPDCLDIPAMKEALGGEYLLLVKHHPFVKHPPAVPADCADFAVDVTGVLAIEDLLTAADLLISDYSSVIFEYSLFERPMIFLAYDLEDYFDWRGFYYDYDELTPGPVVRTTGEVIEYIRQIDTRFDREEVHAFREKFMSSCDGHATDRIMELIGV